MFNVCFGYGEAGLLKHYLSWFRDNRGVDNYIAPYKERINENAWEVILADTSSAEVLHLGAMFLDIGRLDEVNFEQDRKDLIGSFFHELGKRKINKLYREEMDKVDQIVQRARSGETLKIWQSNAPYSACGYYYLIDKLQGIDCDIISVGLKDKFIGHRGQEVTSFGLSNINAYDIAIGVDYAKSLSVNDRNAISLKWQKLKNENAKLRVHKEGEIVSVTPDFFDECIVQNIPLEQDFKETSLAVNVLGNCGHCIEYFYICSRINHMIEQGVFQVIKKAKRKDPPYRQIIRFLGNN
ncbi:MAG: DUF3658 domain-containing protein [Clostridia bacterium]